MIDINKYIGIPYKTKGYDFDGADCFGLVRLFLQNEFGMAMPKFEQYNPDEDIKEVAKQFSLNIPLIAGERVDIPEIGDVALFHFRGIASHIGIYVGNNRVLHILRGTNSTCEAIDSRRLKGRLEGYYGLERKNKT
jgi:cell wall-associated NlpC family hydrolase